MNINRKLIGAGSKWSTPLLMRYLSAAQEFEVQGFTIDGWVNSGRFGWAVSQGSWVYAATGNDRWRRGPATRWHSEECYIDDLGKAFTRAELLALDAGGGR